MDSERNRGLIPYIEYDPDARPTADLGEDGELVAGAANRIADWLAGMRVDQSIDLTNERYADLWRLLDLRDRLILYREALVEVQEQVGAHGYSAFRGRRVRQSWAAELLAKISAVLSRSGH